MRRPALLGVVATVLAATVLAACDGGSSSSAPSGTGSGATSGVATSGAQGSQSSQASQGSAGVQGSSVGKAEHKQGGTVTIADEQGATWTCQFNPFNPSVQFTTVGFVYEPLVFVNLLNNQKATPMLASSYKWGAQDKSIVFTVRKGVMWSDGKPFTAADVAFTFNLLKRVPATDIFALWTGAGLRSVTAAGDQVTMSFDKPASSYFYNFADQVPIVPQHIFGTGAAAAHPDTWADKAPVGTGPYTINPCSATNIQYVANPHYWQAGKPYIQKVESPAYLDNGPANLDLASGKAQWGGQYIPNIKQFYLSKSTQNNTWSPPVTNVEIFPNLRAGHATAKLAVRQAMAAALDRSQLSSIGEGGEEPAANQGGVVLPTFAKYYDAAAVKAAGYDQPNVAKAKSLMASAGYSTSHPLNLKIITITGYTDWDNTLSVIKQELQPIGINLTVQDLGAQTYDSELDGGKFDLAYYGEAGGPTPYYEMRQILYSVKGKPGSNNFEGYVNPQVNALFDQYPTVGDAQQVAIIKQVQAAMVRDVPIIPTVESVDWFQYNTSDVKGWPTEQDQYAQPSPFSYPDLEQVLLHLYSSKTQ